MQTTFVILGFISLLAALVGLLKPGLVTSFLAPKHRTRLKAFGGYVAIFLVAVFMVGTTANNKSSQATLSNQPGTNQMTSTSPKNDNTKPEVQEASIAENKEALRNLLDMLLSFKDDPEFHQKGFGAGLPYTHTWLKTLNEISQEMTVKNGYPLGLATAPNDLRQLGMEYMRSQGRENQFTRDFRQFIEEALTQ